MKPGDHPEFFRFPAPAGRSRESTIRLDREGRFFHDGEPVEHVGLARSFAQWIRRHPDDGRYILSNGYDWCYFTVDGTPYFVSQLESGALPPQLTLFDGSEEPLRLDSLVLEGDGVVTVSVKDGSFRARFSRHAQLQLEPLLREGDPPSLSVGGKLYPIAAAP